MNDYSEKAAFIEQFKSRTKKFVVDNINLFRTLPKTEETRIIGRQLLRSSSSVGANYRAACRGQVSSWVLFKNVACGWKSWWVIILDGNLNRGKYYKWNHVKTIVCRGNEILKLCQLPEKILIIKLYHSLILSFSINENQSFKKNISCAEYHSAVFGVLHVLLRHDG